MAQIVDDTLTDEAYDRFSVQSYLFILQLSRCWTQLLQLSDGDQRIRNIALVFDGMLKPEITAFEQLNDKHGMPPRDLLATSEHRATRQFPRQFFKVAQTGDFLDLLVMLTPDMIGYLEMALHLDERAANDRFTGWVPAYTNAAYQVHCHALTEVLDQTVRDVLGDQPEVHPRWQSLSALFAGTTRMETEFLDMCLTG